MTTNTAQQGADTELQARTPSSLYDTQSQEPVEMPDRPEISRGAATEGLQSTRVLVALPTAPDERTRKACRLKLSLTIARAIVDSGLVLVAFIIAYWLRYGLTLGRDVVAPE